MLILVLLASAMGCIPPSNTSLIGFWESETTSQGGIGHSLEMKENGELVTSFIVMVDGVYRTTAGSLFFAENAKVLAETTEGAPFTITQNLLVQRDSDGQEIRKERLGVQPRASTPLVGDWRYRHYSGAIAYERYTDDGRLLFRLPMGSWRGGYRAAGGSLNMHTPKVNSTMPYALASGRTTLRGETDKSSAYRRAEPWYPRDLVDYQPSKAKGN